MTFKSVKASLGSSASVRKQVQQLRLQHRHGRAFQSDLLRKILQFHPSQKVPRHCREFRVGLDSVMKTPAIFFLGDDGWDTVSTAAAIKNLYRVGGPRYDKLNPVTINVKAAFRREIRDGTRLSFLFDNTEGHANKSRVGVCALCGKRGAVDVDHWHYAFSDILDSFLAHCCTTLSNVAVIKESASVYRLSSKRMCAEWCRWHDAKADYQLLCRTCNCQKGK